MEEQTSSVLFSMTREHSVVSACISSNLFLLHLHSMNTRSMRTLHPAGIAVRTIDPE
jgi:hypothetical protein